MIKVFISYSHDSDAHRQRVLALSDQLREDSVDCYIDQYLNGWPAEGWQRWMEKQIELADFVLVVCTPLYLRRFRGEDREGGRGVNFEGVIISQVLYDDFQQNTKFIPVIPDDGSLDNVPRMLKSGSAYLFGNQYEALYRVLTGQPLATAKPLGKLKHYPTLNDSQSATGSPYIHSDRIPTVKGGFFGRIAELQLLNDAWHGEDSTHPNPSPKGRGANGTRIIQFIAAGGTGKTKLLRYWLDHTSDIPVLIAWSFYSQGSSEDKQTSATPFFSHAFAKLGSTRERFASEEDKGDHLAELLHGKRYVLVLDGLEPLQHAIAAMRGALKDKAIRQLLRQLARHPCGLCIITTRIALHELSDRAAPIVIRHDLQNLTVADGIQLLQSLGVKGSMAELGKAVREYGSHALALSLLGNMLRLRHQGDVRTRDTLKTLVKATGNRDSHHAFKVMQAYEEWFAGEPELALLHLLGLFDHPIEQDVLQMLWHAQIPYLTEGIDEEIWLETIASLREEHRLLSQSEDDSNLDCHPLIREYFGEQLRDLKPKVWEQAHECLYDYYKAVPQQDCPDTLEDMQPLFSAVVHGCAASLHQRALDEVYWPRILREGEFFITRKLGGISDDLAVLSSFFNVPWSQPSEFLSESGKVLMLNLAGVRLRASGRLYEAFYPTRKDMRIAIDSGDWKGAAISAGSLSELVLSLGNVNEALRYANESIQYADLSGSVLEQITKRTTYADALLQAGRLQDVLLIFQEIRSLQSNDLNICPVLYSLPGIRYCDFLLEQGYVEECLNYANLILDLTKNHGELLDGGLIKLIIGRSHLKQRDLQSAKYWLDKALLDLRRANHQEMLVLGLIEHAILLCRIGQPRCAEDDLDNAFDLAQISGMRLRLADCHLTKAQLLVTDALTLTPLPKGESLSYHITEAERLINETGYHRRDKELAELKAYLQ
ncbi:MAG: SEFIR domain-containing protein [Thiolinea sp.]